MDSNCLIENHAHDPSLTLLPIYFAKMGSFNRKKYSKYPEKLYSLALNIIIKSKHITFKFFFHIFYSYMDSSALLFMVIFHAEENRAVFLPIIAGLCK